MDDFSKSEFLYDQQDTEDLIELVLSCDTEETREALESEMLHD